MNIYHRINLSAYDFYSKSREDPYMLKKSKNIHFLQMII